MTVEVFRVSKAKSKIAIEATRLSSEIQFVREWEQVSKTNRYPANRINLKGVSSPITRPWISEINLT